MSKVVWPGSTLLSPVPPVLVSCGSAERPNAITIAWTGILNSHPPMTYISVRPERFSHGLIKARGEFIIHLPTAPMARAIDYCGCRSGRARRMPPVLPLIRKTSRASPMTCALVSTWDGEMKKPDPSARPPL